MAFRRRPGRGWRRGWRRGVTTPSGDTSTSSVMPMFRHAWRIPAAIAHGGGIRSVDDVPDPAGGVGAVLDPPVFGDTMMVPRGAKYRGVAAVRSAVTTGVTMRRSAPRRYLPRLPRRTLTRSLMLIRRRRCRRRVRRRHPRRPRRTLATRRRLRRLRRGRTRRPGSGALRWPRRGAAGASAARDSARVAAVAARAGHVARGEPGARPQTALRRLKCRWRRSRRRAARGGRRGTCGPGDHRLVGVPGGPAVPLALVPPPPYPPPAARITSPAAVDCALDTYAQPPAPPALPSVLSAVVARRPCRRVRARIQGW